ncbi:MAG: methyltransferase domain-containing protein [Ardenticatenia bacterium]|nr:methyltransferase domain-containing protein [Ardenticatenia bacterium]
MEMSSSPPVLSHYQARPLLAARRHGVQRTRCSPDLGLSEVEVMLEPAGVRFPAGTLMRWEHVEEVATHETVCFWVDPEGVPHRIQRFSEVTNRLCALMPTPKAPTLLLAGIPMHRIKDVDPWEDTRMKVKAIAPLRGRVLDTATGLGYTAIQAAATAREVITVELDPAVLDVARLNPWSRPLFETSHIRQLVGDVSEWVTELEAASFTRILHDPPAFRLAGQLYSTAFYRHLYRLLRPGGRLFHYVGDPHSPSGRRVTRGVVRRLREVGFRRVVQRPRAFGVVAYK